MERSAIFMVRWLYIVALPSWCELRNKNLMASFLLGHSIMFQRWKFTCYVIHSHFISSLPSHELIPRKQEKNWGLRFQFLLHEKDIRSRHIHFTGTLEIIVCSREVISLGTVWWLMKPEDQVPLSAVLSSAHQEVGWAVLYMDFTCRRHALEQWYITVLAPGTYSVEDNFSMNQRLGGLFLDD